MGRLAILAALLAVVGCDRPNRPTPNPDFLATALSPSQVVPPVTNVELQGSGIGSVSVVAIRDGRGVITSATLTVEVTLAGFPANTSVTEAHIHRGDLGIEGPIVIDVGIAPGEVPLLTGAGNFVKQGLILSPELAQELVSTPSSFYLDVHSVRNPTGVMRGQLAHQ
jgi:hypothetical protein